MWAGNLPALSQDRRVIIWDIRGHGRSDSPEDPELYSESLSVDDMAGVLDTVGVERAVIGGLSLGGLSLAFHLRYPDRVAALVLCDTGPGYRRDEARNQWNTGTVERYATDLEEHGSRPYAILRGDGLPAAQRPRPGPGGPGHHGPARFPGSRLAATPSRSRTLVLVGADDTPFLAAADVMTAKIPGATKVVLDGAGHAANIDQPEAFDQAMADFLAAI